MTKMTEQMQILLGALARLSTDAHAKADAYVNNEDGEGWVGLGDYEITNYDGEIWYNYRPTGKGVETWEDNIAPSRIESFTKPPKAKNPATA